MSGNMPKLKSAATVEEKLLFLHSQVEQLAKRLADTEKENERLKKLIDPDIKTRSLLNLIREVNAHTSSMPDMKGYNSDHDRRYHIRDTNISVPGIYFKDGGGRRLWWIGIEDGDLVTRFDPNLGIGTPEFENGEYSRYHPNFD